MKLYTTPILQERIGWNRQEQFRKNIFKAIVS